MDINDVCSLLIDSLRNAGYKESTIFLYQGVIRRFKALCRERDVSDYDVR